MEKYGYLPRREQQRADEAAFIAGWQARKQAVDYATRPRIGTAYAHPDRLPKICDCGGTIKTDHTGLIDTCELCQASWA